MSNTKELIIDKKCGGIVKQVRYELKCTQEELGRKIGVDQPTLCRIERRQQLPTEDMLNKLAHLAGVTAYQLTGQEPISYCSVW